MKKLLLTGATGFIGRNIAPLAIERGYEVHAVSSAICSSSRHKPRMFWHQCNLFNTHEAKRLLAEVKPTYLLHLAWVATSGEYWTSLENIRWVQASLDLLINFVKQGGRRAVLAGSCAEYDWTGEYCSENITPLKPQTLYGTCKNCLQEMLFQFSKQTGLSSAWGRIFFVYGPYEARTRLVPSVVISLLQDQPARCTHGKQIRDFLYVEDVASAFVNLLESNVEGPVNIASGQPVALSDIVYNVADALGKRHLVQLGVLPAPELESSFLVADVGKLNQQVGWKPKMAFESGLKNTIKWWEQNLK